MEISPGQLDSIADALAERIALVLGRESTKLLDEHELAERLGVASRTVRDLVRRGELPPALRVGGCNRWSWSRVVEHLEARSARPRRRGRGLHRRCRGGT